MDRFLRTPYIGVALTLGAATAAGLSAPQGVWIVTGFLAVGFFVAAIWVHFRPSPGALARTDVRDLALSLAGELEEANDRIGTAVEQGVWWLPSEAPSASVWSARESELRAFGDRFHRPVRDAYRQIAQHNRKAEQIEAGQYQAVGRVVDDDVGHELSAADRAALEATRGVIAHALDRLGELESSTSGGGRRFVTDEHREALRGELNEAQRAVESGAARTEGEKLMREMFAAHFPELSERLTRWDQAVTRNTSAPGNLKAAIEAKLKAGGLDQAPYLATNIVEGLAVVTAERSLAGTLAEPLPPAEGDPTALWLGWASDEAMAGMVDFNPQVTTAHGHVLQMERDEYPAGEFEARARELLAPLHALLTEAQGWPEAAEILASREARRAYPREGLIEDLKKAQLKPHIPVVAGCHGCD